MKIYTLHTNYNEITMLKNIFFLLSLFSALNSLKLNCAHAEPDNPDQLALSFFDRLTDEQKKDAQDYMLFYFQLTSNLSHHLKTESLTLENRETLLKIPEDSILPPPHEPQIILNHLQALLHDEIIKLIPLINANPQIKKHQQNDTMAAETILLERITGMRGLTFKERLDSTHHIK